MPHLIDEFQHDACKSKNGQLLVHLFHIIANQIQPKWKFDSKKENATISTTELNAAFDDLWPVNCRQNVEINNIE